MAVAARARPAPVAQETDRAPGPEGAARIGPNAILQMIPVLEASGGPGLVDALMADAGLTALPDGHAMIPETDAARLHQALRTALPAAMADPIAAQAGRNTADYILAHRIPRRAQDLLRLLPAALAAPALAKAITRNAWTFAGSGAFRALSSWEFEIADNPVIRGEVADRPLCAWHVAVFERLYRELVAPDVTCREVACCAQGAPACRFALTRG